MHSNMSKIVGQEIKKEDKEMINESLVTNMPFEIVQIFLVVF